MLDARATVLLRGQEPVALGRRAVALLQTLVGRAGEVVTKDELMAGAWGGLAVEDSNLTVQIAALRRLFAAEPGAEGWIETLPRRGYRFVGPVASSGPGATLNGAIGLALDPVTRGDALPSLAVLPFRRPGPQPVPSYVADALEEDTITALAGLAELVVISRGSTFRFRDTHLDPATIGRQLGVRYLVSGSVRQADSLIRVSAELAEAATGAVLSSRVHEGSSAERFDARDRLVSQIVRAVAPKVREGELRRIQLKRPESLLAYDLVMQARELIYQLDRDSFALAHEYLQKAIDAEPGYAAGYSLYAELYSLRLGQGWSADRGADADAVERFAQLAIDRDPNDARALAWYGHSRALLKRDYTTALALFERALTISPSNAAAWMWSSVAFSYLEESALAVERGERALRLSPLDWFGFQFSSTLCLAHYTSGSFAEAARWGTASIAENPRYLSNLRYTIASLVALGETAQARLLARDVLRLEPDLRVSSIVARHPYRDLARREAYGRRLVEAGLPP
ncbi:MAG: winged helix-turn-helix domain-containing tetratricopeptide repeat protein [Acetobacteraceae bacterium]